MTKFFAINLLQQLDDDVDLNVLTTALQKSREVGFEFRDEEQASEHFRDELGEIIDAYQNGSDKELLSEAGDSYLAITEMLRRRGLSPEEALKKVQRKFIGRLAYVEKRLQEQGKTWDDVTWTEDVKPIWEEAKVKGDDSIKR